MMFLVNKKARRLRYLEPSGLKSKQSTSNTVLGVTVLVFTVTFASLFPKRLESDSVVELSPYSKRFGFDFFLTSKSPLQS